MWLEADASGRLVDASDAILHELGFEKSELVGRHIWEVAPPPREDDARDMWSEFGATGEQRGVFELVRADGSRVALEYRAESGQGGVSRSYLRPVGERMRPSAPLDVCPFPRPFRPDFTDCNVFDPMPMRQTDASGTPLGAQWTCRHLEAGTFSPGRHYPRCGLGGTITRTRRLLALSEPQLRIRRLRQESTVALAPDLERLMLARDQAESDLGRARDQFLERFAQWSASRSAELAAAGINAAELTRALTTATNDFLRHRGRSQWSFDAEAAERFSPEITAFLRPDLSMI